LALLAVCPVLSGCGRRANTALGRLREITVASDWWELVEPVVRGTFQDTVFTPQPEPRFRLKVYTGKQFASYRLLRNVFLVGVASDTAVRTVLGARADSLPESGYGLFLIPNAWADNQQLVVFAAAHESLLVRGLESYGPRLSATFRDIVLRNVVQAVYFRGRDEKKTGELYERYAFGLDVPKDWFLKQEHADARFVYMFAHYPDRSVFVYWQESVRPLETGPMLDLRDTLTGRYYEGDRAERSYAVADTVEFLAEPALRLQGVWQNEKQAIGGPFVSYCFNHEGRFFMADGQVFLPGKPKLDQLLQVEAIVRSFTPR